MSQRNPTLAELMGRLAQKAESTTISGGLAIVVIRQVFNRIELSSVTITLTARGDSNGKYFIDNNTPVGAASDVICGFWKAS